STRSCCARPRAIGRASPRRATSSRWRSCATATARRSPRPRRWLVPDPRVLGTGAGGPSGISILRAMEGEAVEMLAAAIDPFAAVLYLVDAERRFLLPRGDDPRFATDLLARCAREGIEVIVPTVDTELLPLARMRDEFEAALVLASEATLAVCLD